MTKLFCFCFGFFYLPLAASSIMWFPILAMMFEGLLGIKLNPDIEFSLGMLWGAMVVLLHATTIPVIYHYITKP